MPTFYENKKGFNVYVNSTKICQELFVLTLNVYMQPNTFCFNFKLLSKNRYSKRMCCLHLAAKLSLIDPIGRKENVLFVKLFIHESFEIWQDIIRGIFYKHMRLIKIAKVCLYFLYVYFYTYFINTQFL